MLSDYCATVQDDLLVKVIFGKFVCEKQLTDFIMAIQATTSFFFVLNCGYNMGMLAKLLMLVILILANFSEKLPIANNY